MEIKSSETFNYSFIKGLEYYEQIAKEKNTRKFLIYAGDESYKTKDVAIYSYKKINDLFNEINGE
jgi:hypothetical protein